MRPGRYLIRPRREGDVITLGKRPSKTVKKLMIEGRVPACRRELVPVVDGGGRAAALASARIWIFWRSRESRPCILDYFRTEAIHAMLCGCRRFAAAGKAA